MINNKKVTVVLPAYNAAKTLEKTIGEIPFDIVDDIILCDDNSTDNTIELAKKLKMKYQIHDEGGTSSSKDTLDNRPVLINLLRLMLTDCLLRMQCLSVTVLPTGCPVK